MGRKTLGGSLFIRNGIEFDYNFLESIACLCELCDHVVVVDAGSDDKTNEVLHHVKDYYQNLSILFLDKAHWDDQHGSQKLAYFTNIAIQGLKTDYQINLQSDEIIHEDSFPWIREAIETGKEGFMAHRINLWGTPYHQLDVPHDRMPCSDYVIRLAKTQYLSTGDGESLDVHPIDESFADKIEIYHLGFVRRREVMKAKISHMQKNVFEMENHDPKLDTMEVFDPYAWFSKEDLKPISKKLPKFITEWAAERAKDYGF